MLSLFPFVDQSVVAPTVALLPLASYVLLLFAHRQYDGEEGPSAKREASFIEGGVRRLRTQIPFEEDRKFIVLKGLFALLYSVSLGFAACASLASWLYPGNAVVIGFGNVAAALVMVAVLRRRERDVCNVLPKLFLPVTSFCYLFLGALWPTEGVLVCAAVLFVLFGCYEILNAHTAYAYSSYDAVRCLWELYSSKTGNSVGFFLGWACATASLFCFEADTTTLLVLCFFMVSLAAVVDTALFKEMKLEFREVVVDNEPTLEVLDAKNYEALLQGRGRVEPRLRGACRAVQALAAAERDLPFAGEGAQRPVHQGRAGAVHAHRQEPHLQHLPEDGGALAPGADRSGGERREGRLKPAGAGMPWAEAVLARRRLVPCSSTWPQLGRSLRTPGLPRVLPAGEHAPLTGHLRRVHTVGRRCCAAASYRWTLKNAASSSAQWQAQFPRHEEASMEGIETYCKTLGLGSFGMSALSARDRRQGRAHRAHARHALRPRLRAPKSCGPGRWRCAARSWKGC